MPFFWTGWLLDLLGVEGAGKRRIAHEIGKQHAYLPPLTVRTGWHGRGRLPQCCDRLEQSAAMTDRDHA